MNDAFCVTFGCFCMWSCFTNFCMTLHVLKSFLVDLKKNQTCFSGQVCFHDFTLFCWIEDKIAEFTACMHSFASQETSSTESFQGDKKSHITCMYPLCCVVEKSR